MNSKIEVFPDNALFAAFGQFTTDGTIITIVLDCGIDSRSPGGPQLYSELKQEERRVSIRVNSSRFVAGAGEAFGHLDGKRASVLRHSEYADIPEDMMLVVLFKGEHDQITAEQTKSLTDYFVKIHELMEPV